MDADLFLVVSRLMATLGRMVVLARHRRQPVIVVLVCVLLDALCHAMDAIERFLRDDAE